MLYMKTNFGHKRVIDESRSCPTHTFLNYFFHYQIFSLKYDSTNGVQLLQKELGFLKDYPINAHVCINSTCRPIHQKYRKLVDYICRVSAFHL